MALMQAAAISSDAIDSLCALITSEPERTVTSARVLALWERVLRQPSDDARYAVAALTTTGRLERTGPGQWTATKAGERTAPPPPAPVLPAGHAVMRVGPSDDPAQQVTVSGPRERVEAVVRAYQRQQVAGNAKPLPPREVRVGKDTLPPRPMDEQKRQRLARVMAVASLTPAARRIYSAIVTEPSTTPDLGRRADLDGVPYNTIRGRVSELAGKGLIRRRDDGAWEAA